MQGEIITSRQNPLVKTVCALSEKKARRESGLFRFDGKKLLGEAIASSLEIKYVVYNAEGGAADYVLCHKETLAARGARVVAVSGSVFDKISEERSPEGVVTVAAFPKALVERYSDGARVRDNEKILVAEAVRDPANLGTIMRSAYALGIDRLVITDDCAEIYSPKTIRSAMGAAFRLPVLEVPAGSLKELIGELREEGGRRAFATALDDSSAVLGEMELRRGDFFVIGNEGHGLTQETVEACDGSVIIPMREGAESLNAAAAAAICVWETVRIGK